MIYLGIDPTAGRRPLNYALLDGKLNIVAEHPGHPDDLFRAIAPYAEIMCAVDAPCMANKGLLSDPAKRAEVGLAPDKTTYTQYRVCEYALRSRGINLYNTPAEILSAPKWMQAGWALYDRLREVGFEPHTPGSTAPRQFFEVHPHATFTVRLGRIPYRKDTLEGRLQRQLLLYEEGVRLLDAMDVLEEVTRHRILQGRLELRGLRTHDELDALASALTAYYAHLKPREVTLVGDPVDGQIVVPTADLKEKYE
jgi:predicted nuclease with RNAse H fold